MVTLENVHTDELRALGSAAEFVLQEVPSLFKRSVSISCLALSEVWMIRTMSCCGMTLADDLPWLSPGCESARERRQVFSELSKEESTKPV